MKALSLLQPWASLIVVGAKKWETRAWKPSTTMLYILRNSVLLMEQAGDIAHLRRQVMFPLHVAGRLVCSYIADFVYVDLKLGRQVVEDSKGMRTKDYRIKAKLYAALHEHPILET